MIKVYCAGPDVFRSDAKEYLESVRSMLFTQGLYALIPLDNEIKGGFGIDLAAEIYRGNVKMIDECDVVMANIEPFRGPHMDPGTAFEIGYAAAKGKRIYCYTPHAYDTMYHRVSDALGRKDEKHDSHGQVIEDFGETENLMITVPAECIFPTIEETAKAISANLRLPR